jgi:oxygen-independent coproporphyrinogen-3 oxidase
MEQALALGAGHVATYGLTYEKGTRLWKQRERGELRALNEEAEYHLYMAAMTTLEHAGFEHYEISNFARPGHRCRHNQVYWANHAYFGFGVGAARYVDGVRELNTRDTRTYIKRLLAGASPVFQSECLPPRERAIETIAVQQRRASGIVRHDFQAQTGFDLDELIGSKIQDLVIQNVVSDDGSAITLTRKGKCLGDAIIEILMRHADQKRLVEKPAGA